MRKFLIFCRLDGTQPVADAIRTGRLSAHGTFEVPSRRTPEQTLPQDPRFLYVEQGVGRVYHFDTERFAIAPLDRDLIGLLLPPETAEGLTGKATTRLRFAPRLGDHPKRNRIVYDTFVVAHHGTHEFRLSWDAVRTSETVDVVVTHKRLVNLLVRVIETAIQQPNVQVEDLLSGARAMDRHGLVETRPEASTVSDAAPIGSAMPWYP